MDLLRQFQHNWKQKHFAKNNENVLLAVSGGIDSMVMCDLFRRAGMLFSIAHCNFNLRGEDSKLDEALVVAWAKQNNIPFFVTGFDTLRFVDEWKTGIQETARKLRYTWLEEKRKMNGYVAVATAHHANDNAETLLINLLKGTGIRGLHGIREKNDKVIRPILFARRSDIEKYASDYEISFRNDSSNASDKYLRNAVRLHIIPVAEKYFPDVVGRLNESIDHFSGAELLYQQQVNIQLKKMVEKRGNDIYIPILKLKKAVAAQTLCYELLKGYGFSSAQVGQVYNLCEAESGRFISSSSHTIIRDRDFLILTANKTEETDFIIIDESLPEVRTEGKLFRFSEIDVPEHVIAAANIALIDLKQLQFPLVLRKWRMGDYFYPLGMGMKKKKLSRFFIDQKVPLHEKDQIWIIESAKRIAWISGFRLDERFKITPQTRKVLKVELIIPNSGDGVVAR